MSTEGRGCPVVLMNPLVAEQTEMRRSLLLGLLQSVAYNEAHGTPNVHPYEVGSLFHGRENASLPKETKSVAGVLGPVERAVPNMKYRKLRFFLARALSRSCSPSCASRRFASVPSRARATLFCSRVVRPRFCPAAPYWAGSARFTPRRARRWASMRSSLPLSSIWTSRSRAPRNQENWTRVLAVPGC